MLNLKFKSYLAQFDDKGLLRQRHLYSDAVINFSSNDYLSLTTEPLIQAIYQEAFKKFSTGSGGSMLAGGYHLAHQLLEQDFATALKVDQCILFSSGYAANLSVLNLLGAMGIHVLIDKNIHASVYDGLKLSGAGFTRYRHNDIEDLSEKLKHTSDDKVLITESIFSMSGQLAPLDSIARLCKSHNCGLLVDEAHAFGVVGKEGLGAVVAFELNQDDVPLRIIPLGKAGAFSGAIVAGKKRWMEALLQCGRSYTYSTAMSPAVAHGLMKTLEVIRKAKDRRKKLFQLVDYFRANAAASKFTWRDSSTPIQQLQLGCPKRALTFSEKLNEKGIVCFPMRMPTVTKQETGLRIILNYHHQPQDIDYLFNELEKI